jgi:hypothetical protein
MTRNARAFTAALAAGLLTLTLLPSPADAATGRAVVTGSTVKRSHPIDGQQIHRVTIKRSHR